MASLNIEAEVESVAFYLSSSSINVTREWLTGCIQYFQSENSNCTIAETKQFVIKQWELSDLRESSSGCLPNNLKSQRKITLRQKYALQVESIINISSSAYSQIQKIRKADIENVVATEKKPEAWEPKPGRMLKMKLCDGVQVVEALEYQPLHMIDENVTPGTKVIIMGPVDCRRGIFFLKPANLKVIGGEVDSMLIVNHLENVLARALNLSENDNPFAIQTQETRALSITSESVNLNETLASDYAENLPGRHMNPPPNCYKAEQSNYTSNSVSRREQEVCSDIVDIDVSAWEDDDLFKEVHDKEVPPPRQQNTAGHHVIQFGNSFTNSKMAYSNRTGLKENTTSEITNEAEIKITNTSTSQTRNDAVSNVRNTILASDEYVDSMLLDEWDDEEMINNEFFNAASNSGQLTSVALPGKSVNKTASQVTNSTKNNIPFNHQVLSHTSKNHLSEASKKLRQVPPQRASLSNWLNKSRDSTSVSSSPSQASANSSLRPSQGSDKTAGPTAESNHLSKLLPSMKRPKSPSHFNINKKIKETECTKSEPTISFDNVCNEPKTFDDEDDWAEAYLNRQNFGFLNNCNDSSNTKNDLRESHKKQSGNDSHKTNEGKEEVSLVNNMRKEGMFPKEIKTVQQESFDFHHKPQCHLPAAFCSPSDVNPVMDVHLVDKDEMAIDGCVFPEASLSSSKLQRQSLNTCSQSSVNPRSRKQPELSWSFPTNSSPFEYLLHILHPSTNINGVHKVKGTIFYLLSQLNFDADSGWHLSAQICDGTGTLDVDFTSEVLEGIIGLSHREFIQMRKEASKNPLVKQKLMKLLKDTKQKMIDLNSIFTVKFEQGKMASVINISDVTKQDVNKMRLRLGNI